MADENSKEEMKIYDGKKAQCDACKRSFTTGQIIDVNADDLVFCYSRSTTTDCSVNYFQSNPDINCQQMKFDAWYDKIGD